MKSIKIDLLSFISGFGKEACQAGRCGQLEVGPPHLQETSFKAAGGSVQRH